MDLTRLKNASLIGTSKVLIMDNMKEEYPELFNKNGLMKYEIFEEKFIPKYPIQIRMDKNSISFTLKNENNKNGCTIEDIEAAIEILKIIEINKSM